MKGGKREKLSKFEKERAGNMRLIYFSKPISIKLLNKTFDEFFFSKFFFIIFFHNFLFLKY